ncbi:MULTISPECIES: helix-turn-helix transcriptional regulator [Streptomyces]|uniref:Helix-turn-helix transcriptional regulator n=1 Tax=Streptomyces anthocyanicus TaxID=68174 RepID=A0ABZ1MBH4_9ACTN|nr:MULTISPECIES: helix-turn-helix transcriptional regulator [Streptomyces]BDE44247.1 transcriptional regulator [Streptomyces lividans]EFD64429.1 DNA-binding protein [Streptomyces lividans TK24]MBQ0949016.1 helix-turn-helix domain-containing protein [Streptomyces sp. RK76]MDX3315393.1 helix-turn-helix transcriptional regulator [Streptomyces sp. ME03-5684b]WSB58793.1 helix-turn-helix transcriptional regulator [Streptomyces anthocyanicus]
MSSQELADFLRRRREDLRPEDVQTETTPPPSRRARRTPGLRREEVAALAQVSVSYYERLEQARAPRPSPQVLSALATALQLTDAERDHLARLAGQVLPAENDGAPEHVPEDAQQLLGRLDGIPAYIVNDRQDIVAWNAAAAALITDFSRLTPDERNLTRISTRFRGTLCTGAPGSESEFSQQVAAQLRAASVLYPTDKVLAELINEFATHDPDFASSWRNHAVRPIPGVRKRLHHPKLGELEIDRHTLSLPGSGFSLVMYTAEVGSPSAAALKSL